MRATYNKFLSFGLTGYRWNNAVSVMIGGRIQELFLGYAFDYPSPP